MKTEILIVPVIYLGFALLEMLRSNFWSKPNQKRSDGIVEFVSTLTVMGLTQPTILLTSALLMSLVFPGAQDALTGLPLIAKIALFLVFEDMMQYWWHRASHSSPFLYNLHRAHHAGEYMSVRIVYRNNIFYYAMMPSLWFAGVLIYMGLGPVYIGYVIVKMLVIIAAHSDMRWDEPLYRIKALSPLMWLVERIISTPSTHSAHHGKHVADGITNYKGNFGNLLFFWDVLFGTAKITRRYPDEIGVENLPPVTAGAQLLWPIVRG